MSTLRAFQKDFSAAVKADDPRARPQGLSDDQAWRFDVYRNNFFYGLIEQLKEAYPAIRSYLGDDGFVAVARGFLVHYPPSQRSLALFGGDFPDYLAQIPLTKDDPAICDLARAERARLEALHAADALVLDPGRLQELGDTLLAARFVQHDAARLVTSQIPLIDHWRVNRPGSGGAVSQNTATGAQAVLVTRPKLSVQICALTIAEARFGSELFDGKPVAEAFETALTCDDAFDITETFRKFLAAGAFKNVLA